jgi:hypothetical protein
VRAMRRPVNPAGDRTRLAPVNLIEAPMPRTGARHWRMVRGVGDLLTPFVATG